MQYLVNQIIPNKGNIIRVSKYQTNLRELGYNHYQSIGSLGGSKTQGIITIKKGMVIRN